MSSTVVSVLFPVRNASRHLSEAIASIEEQTFEDFEVLAVDDGSSDGSGGLLDEWCARDPRVRLLAGGEPESPLGVAGALELARRHASGRYLARMDADDVTPTDRFARQVELMDREPRTALCGPDSHLA